jgi:NAD(P)-dependent dehydrogenase (short-subunit alcohol dehydrogenase family)
MSNFLIVGASSGIGLQLAHQLAESGHRVYGTYHTHPQADVPPNLSYHALNVLENETSLDFLPDTLDGLVYCPGSIQLKPFARITPKDFESDFQLQVSGCVNILQKALPKLKASQQASVVFFSTVAVQTGLNYHSLVSTSKGAIEGLTRALSAELAPRIRVNCIAPSLTDTPMSSFLLNTEEKKEANAQRHPLKRIGTAADIANMAEFLLTHKSVWITGQVFHVDGGISTIK